MSGQRGLLWIVGGLALGLALGLLVSLVISPVRYHALPPGLLNETARDEFRRMIALAYTASGDLPRARARLELLDGGDSTYLLAAQAQRMLSESGSPQAARALAALAADLDSPPQTALPALRTATPAPGQQPSATATITNTPAPTFTPLPSATPLAAPDRPFLEQARQEVCDASAAAGVLQVQVSDAQGTPLAGVPVTVTWQSGQETFYTGLAPELNPGYADFVMTTGELYTLVVGSGSAPVEGLVIPDCGGSLRLAFRQGPQ